MKKIITAVLLSVAALFVAPNANADASSYLQALNERGMSITNVQAMLVQGYAVCKALDSVNGSVVGHNLQGDPWYYTENEAGAILLSAVEELCPWQDHRQANQIA